MFTWIVATYRGMLLVGVTSGRVVPEGTDLDTVMTVFATNTEEDLETARFQAAYAEVVFKRALPEGRGLPELQLEALGPEAVLIMP